jgi:uncharacterized membrane protein
MNKQIRVFELDVLRGIAVVLMVFFHFGFDLAEFGYASYETTVDMEWKVFRAVILSMFLLAVGMSSYLAYANGVNKKKLFKNLFKLSLVSLVISIGSYVAFPHSWIYFGVIHFIVLAIPLSLVFLKVPRIALVLGLILMISYPLGYLHMDYLHSLGVEYLHIPSFTVDVVSLSPWFGMVLIGIFVMHKHIFNIKLSHNAFMQKMAFLGKHSLLIYLVHQPILFGTFTLVKVLL